MAEHPSQLMRRAASRLRELAKSATPGPWLVAFIDGVIPAVDAPGRDGHLIAEALLCQDKSHSARPRADAEWIAVLHPGAGLALAGWLEREANRADKDVSRTLLGWWCHECGDHAGGCGCRDGALSTAREILGESNEAATAAGQEDGDDRA